MTRRRVEPRAELRNVVLMIVLAAGMLLVSTAGVWITGEQPAPPPLPPQDVSADAAEVAGPVRALGLVVLAAAPALLATRGAGRVVVGLLLVLAGIGAHATALLVWADPIGALEAARGEVAAGTTDDLAASWRPQLAMAAGLLTVLTGGLVLVVGRRLPALGRRYEPPAAAGTPAAAGPAGEQSPGSTAVPVGEAQLWDALDRGEDPTRS